MDLPRLTPLLMCIVAWSNGQVTVPQPSAAPIPLPPPWPCSQPPLDIVLLLDSSGSIQAKSFEDMKKFVASIIVNMDVTAHRIGIASFSTAVRVEYNLGDCSDQTCYFDSTAQITKMDGQTNLVGGLELVLDQMFQPGSGDRPNADNLLLVITDGQPTVGGIPTPALITSLHAQARVMTFAVGAEADSDIIYGIASDPLYQNAFLLSDYSDFQRQDFAGAVSSAVCNQLPAPRVEQAPAECFLDIGLLADFSGSITDPDSMNLNNWLHLRLFLQNFIRRMHSQYKGNVKVAFEWFRTQPHFEWDLAGKGPAKCKDHLDTDCMVMRLNSINNPSGQTRMSIALEEMRNKIWLAPSNDRKINDLLIFITDGFPTAAYDPTAMAQQLKNIYNIRIMGIGVTNNVEVSTMRRVVSQPFEDNFVNITDFSQLMYSIDEIAKKTCFVVEKNLTCQTTGDIVFLLDASSSMTGDDFDCMKRFIKNISLLIPISDTEVRIGLAQFSSSNRFSIKTHLKDHNTQNAIFLDLEEMMWTGGDTATEVALSRIEREMFTARQGDRPDKKNVLVIFTDGDAQKRTETMQAAISIKSKGVHVVVVKIGSEFNEHLLHGLASHPWQDNLIEARNFTGLCEMDPSIKDKLIKRICDNKDNDSTCLDDLDCKNGGTPRDDHGICYCECPAGFSGTDCSKPCEFEADICLIVDRSGSIANEDFKRQMEFLRNFASGVGNFDHERLCLLSFADDASSHFEPGAIMNKNGVINAMAVHHSGGGTNTGAALDLSKRVFQRTRRVNQKGEKIPQIAVVFTDGGSQDKKKTRDSAGKLKNNGEVEVIAVRMGKPTKVDRQELMDIASQTSNIIELDGYHQLNSIIGRLYDIFCNDSCAGKVCLNGGTPVGGITHCECKCLPGYTGPDCGRGCSDQIDIVLLVDASGSIRRERFPFVIQFLRDVFGNIKVGPDNAHVGAVSWSTRAQTEFQLSDYQSTHDVVNGISQIRFVGQRTNIYRAIQIARTNIFSRRGDRRNVPDFALMFTDGGANIERDRTPEEAVRLKKAGVHVVVVAVGDDMNIKMLKAIASFPFSENLLTVQRAGELPAIVEKAHKTVCNDQDECASNPCQNGAQCKDDLHVYWCECPRQFQGSNCQYACGKQLDIVLVLDYSGSVHHVYDIILEFAKSLINNLNIDSGDVRVGVVSYSNRANVQFSLNEYKTKKGVLNAIYVHRLQGTTNTQEGIFRGRNNFRRGNRVGVDDVMIVVTDGQSNVRRERTIPEADQARRNNIKVIGVGIGFMNRAEVNGIADDPDQDFTVFIDTTADIDNAVESVITMACA